MWLSATRLNYNLIAEGADHHIKVFYEYLEAASTVSHTNGYFEVHDQDIHFDITFMA